MTFLDDLRNQVRAMPDKIKEASEKVNKAKANLRQLEAEYNMAIATSYLSATGSIHERQAKAEVENAELHNKVLEAKEELDQANTVYEYGEDLFVSLRKEASMVEAELKNLNN